MKLKFNWYWGLSGVSGFFRVKGPAILCILRIPVIFS